MRAHLAIALLATTLLAACTPREPVRIGFVGGLSGRVADLGEAARNGFLLAIEEANTGGGIDGRRIEPLVRDDAQDPARARQATEELAAAGVAAIVGPLTSAMAAPVLAAASQAGIPVVSPTVTTTALTGKDDLLLRVISDTAGYSSLAARFHYQRGVRRVAAVFDTRNRAYTEDWLNGFRRTFAAQGGRMVAEIPFESGDSIDHEQIVRTLLSHRPDALLFVSAAVDTALFAQQARKIGGGQTLIGVEWAATERLIELGGRAVDGMFVGQFFDRHAASPDYLAMREAYAARFRSPPGFASVAAYDATRAIIEARRRAPASTPLKQALLEQGPFAGAQQPIAFDRFGDAQRRTFITEIRDGQFVAVE